MTVTNERVRYLSRLTTCVVHDAILVVWTIGTSRNWSRPSMLESNLTVLESNFAVVVFLVWQRCKHLESEKCNAASPIAALSSHNWRRRERSIHILRASSRLWCLHYGNNEGNLEFFEQLEHVQYWASGRQTARRFCKFLSAGRRSVFWLHTCLMTRN